MTASQICAIHLGPRGRSYTTRDQALTSLRDDMAKALVKPVTDQAAALKAAFTKQRVSRFYSFRDMSHESEDIRQDGDRERRARWLSPTRDMMQGPAWDHGHSQALYSNGDASIPVFGKREGAGFDSERFVDEIDKLNRRGMLKPGDMPDFDSDESLIKLFGLVNDMAIEEALKRSPDRNGQKNRIVDNAPGIYLFSELLKRTNILIEEDFTELWARRIFAIRNLNTWMPQWLFRRVDTRTTLPEYIDIERLPSNAQRGSENVAPDIRNLAFYHHGASWTKLELMRWAEAQSENGAANFQLDRSRIDNAIRMMNFKEDLITFFGDTDVNILGLFSPQAKTGIERLTAVQVAGGGFGTDGSERDRQLLTGVVKRIREVTETVLHPDTIMLSLRSFDYVNDTLYGTPDSDAGTNRTVQSMAMQTLEKLGIKDILMVPEVGYSAAQETRLKAQNLSDTAAAKYAGGIGDQKQAMVVCNREAHVMEMIVAKDRIMYPAQEERRDQVETRMMQGSGGLAVYKPAGATIVTDVGPAPIGP